MSNTLDRSAASQALAKVLAYQQCGKPVEAAEWADKLIGMLASATAWGCSEKNEYPVCNECDHVTNNREG